jgi:outer membrane protein assembly factor BamB
MKDLLSVVLLLLLPVIQFFGQDPVAQWHGPDRSGIYPETGLYDTWPDNGPTLIWSANDLGRGYASPVVTDRGIYVTGMKDTLDYLTKLSLQGKVIWEVPFGRAWSNSFPDTRTTPTVQGNRVYVISGKGDIASIDADDGSIEWKIDGAKTFDARWGDWGICESPLLVRGKLIYSPAGPSTTLVALDKHTGSVVWESHSLNDTSAYVSPILMQMDNKNIVVTTLGRYLVGVDADNGDILWKYDYAGLLPEESLKVWPGAPFTNTITPLIRENRIYITSGYNHVGAMFELGPDGRSIDLVWTDTTLDCHHGGVVLLDGKIYGSNWINNANGNWCCIDWHTGETHWENKWHTKGSIIGTPGKLIIYEEKKGHVGLVKPNAEKMELVSSFQVPLGKGPHWAHPVIFQGILYIRHGGVLMAYKIGNP